MAPLSASEVEPPPARRFGARSLLKDEGNFIASFGSFIVEGTDVEVGRVVWRSVP
jgi:hypothetical protein